MIGPVGVSMRHLIRKRKMGPLQADILLLIRTGFAVTTSQIISWLRTTYVGMVRQNAANAIARLIERGHIERTKRGVYQCLD